MKFLHYAALIATTSAVRLVSLQQDAPTIDQLVEVNKHIPDPQEVWEHFDKNGDNKWDLKEAMAAFKGTMKYYGHPLPQGWKSMIKRRFKQADTSGDGFIDPKEMLTVMFKQVDWDNNGVWTKDEVHNMVKMLARMSKNKLIKTWKKDVDAVFDEVDVNKDGTCTPKELLAALEKHGFPDINDLFEHKEDAKLTLDTLMQHPNPQEVWKYFDKDGNGSWSLEETMDAMSSGMTAYGGKLPKHWKAKVLSEFKKMDKNGDGQVSSHEMGLYLFSQMMAYDTYKIPLSMYYQTFENIAMVSGNTLISNWKNDVQNAFLNADLDGSQMVSPKQLMNELTHNGQYDLLWMFL